MQVESDIRSHPIEPKVKTMKKLIQSLVVAGLMATAGGVAFAQMGEGMMGHDGMHRMDPAKMAQMHTKHLADLKAKLKITASQEAAWTAFTDAMKPPADMMDKRPDRAEMDKLPTPERIDKMRALHKEHMTAMEAAMDKRAEATKTFYAALSPEQKKTFDAEHARMDMRGDRQHHMHGGPDAKPAPAPKQ
jgi:Spy/CpxP family protein refolding chaperone